MTTCLKPLDKFRSDVSVACWGDNGFGQLGDGTFTDSNIPVTVSGLTNATRVSTGFTHTCATRSDYTVACWGENGSGQRGDGTNTDSTTPVTVTGLTDAVDIAAGTSHVCAIRGDSTVACWGYNTGAHGNGTYTDTNIPAGPVVRKR